MKNIFITGVSSGLGNGLAKYYLDNGYRVFAMNRSEPNELLSHPNFKFQSVDFKDLDTISDAFYQLTRNLEGGFSLAILNSGIIGEIKDLRECSIKELKETCDINLWANQVLINCLLEGSIDQIVAISSGASVNGNRGWNGYSISKSALNMLIKLYSDEIKETHFTSLAPGLIDSPMQDYLCSINDERYPALEILKKAKGSETMPSGETLAPRLAKAISLCQEYDSGSYLDIRQMPITYTGVTLNQ